MYAAVTPDRSAAVVPSKTSNFKILSSASPWDTLTRGRIPPGDPPGTRFNLIEIIEAILIPPFKIRSKL
jgi:hypothetical protein